MISYVLALGFALFLSTFVHGEKDFQLFQEETVTVMMPALSSIDVKLWSNPSTGWQWLPVENSDLGCEWSKKVDSDKVVFDKVVEVVSMRADKKTSASTKKAPTSTSTIAGTTSASEVVGSESVEASSTEEELKVVVDDPIVAHEAQKVGVPYFTIFTIDTLKVGDAVMCFEYRSWRTDVDAPISVVKVIVDNDIDEPVVVRSTSTTTSTSSTPLSTEAESSEEEDEKKAEDEKSDAEDDKPKSKSLRA